VSGVASRIAQGAPNSEPGTPNSEPQLEALHMGCRASSDTDTDHFPKMRSGIALGSNIGNRLANLREAYQQVVALNTIGAVVRTSSIYETSPVDSQPGTEEYFNAVMEIGFDGSPISLLDRLLEIELKMGRPSRRPRNSPRKIDLDVLYVGDLVLNEPAIIVPHPRLAKRRFVLAPLAEILPGLVLPGQSHCVSALLEGLNTQEKVRKLHYRLSDS
jgi:2-amino-4-hydroxy-6-hydroxymethyldihydropteridine diphosphokinase